MAVNCHQKVELWTRTTTRKTHQKQKSMNQISAKTFSFLNHSRPRSSPSMASVSLPSFLSPLNSNTLSSSFVVSAKPKLPSSPAGFWTVKLKSPRTNAVVCRAASVVFRDLDADDFRHPLDKQVSLVHTL